MSSRKGRGSTQPDDEAMAAEMQKKYHIELLRRRAGRGKGRRSTQTDDETMATEMQQQNLLCRRRARKRHEARARLLAYQEEHRMQRSSAVLNQEEQHTAAALDRRLAQGEDMPGYDTPKYLICVVPDLMGRSHMENKIAFLQQQNQEMTLSHRGFQDTASRFVARAFDLRPYEAPYFHGKDSGNIAQGNFYDGFVAYYSHIKDWQKPVLHAALRQMLSSNHDKDSLQITCGLLLRASRECMARKQDVFTNVIDRSVEDKYSMVMNSAMPSLDDHKKALYNASHIALDQLKNIAFSRVFLEPSKMYFRAVHDSIMEGDVEVHGSNTYLAILLKTLNVKLPRSPLWEDDVKGVASFKEALYPQDLKKLWTPDTKGLTWEQAIGYGKSPNVSHRVQRNQFYVGGGTADGAATNCLLAASQSSTRQRILPYLEAFANFFTEQQVTAWLCNYFLNQSNLQQHLNIVFKEIASEQEIRDANGEAKFWLWDIMTYKFRSDRGLKLLRFVGICKKM